MNLGPSRHVRARVDARASGGAAMRLLLLFTVASWALPAAAQTSDTADSPTTSATPTELGDADSTRSALPTEPSDPTASPESSAGSTSLVPPPPVAPSPVEGPRELFRFGDVVPAGLGDALWARDRDAALAAIDAARTPLSPGVACTEAVLRDLELQAAYLPREPPVDRLSARLFADTHERVTRTFERTLRAHRRCLASGLTVEPSPLVVSSGTVRIDLDDALRSLARREDELSRLAPQIASHDLVQAHAGLAAAVGIEIDSSSPSDGPTAGALAPPSIDPRDPRDARDTSHAWNVASAFYVASHGRLPIPDERKVEPNWRLSPLLVGAMELGLGLALIPATARSNGGLLDDGRVRLGLVGLAVGGVVSLILFPTWLERDRRGRLLAGGLAVLASIGLGLGTALADVRPRLRAFGITLATTSVVDVAFWIGGAVIQRRWRPNASVSRHHATLGGTYMF